MWEDGDGTEHYFAQTGSQPYKDQEGMDLELNLYDDYIIIRDKKDNRMRFDILEQGLAMLVAVRDALNNEVTYTYVAGYEKQGRISKITDPVGRETVSYTHLDVYKRQAQTASAECADRNARRPAFDDDDCRRFCPRDQHLEGSL